MAWHHRHPLLALAMACFIPPSTGCATNAPRASFETSRVRTTQNAQAARDANERGLAFVEVEQFDQAEHAFREALQHDIRYAPAHNNLGLVLLTQGKVYDAAVEFRMASKLDPSATQPLANLARLYERIGWTKEAQAQLNLIYTPKFHGQADLGVFP